MYLEKCSENLLVKWLPWRTQIVLPVTKNWDQLQKTNKHLLHNSSGGLRWRGWVCSCMPDIPGALWVFRVVSGFRGSWPEFVCLCLIWRKLSKAASEDESEPSASLVLFALPGSSFPPGMQGIRQLFICACCLSFALLGSLYTAAPMGCYVGHSLASWPLGTGSVGSCGRATLSPWCLIGSEGWLWSHDTVL